MLKGILKAAMIKTKGRLSFVAEVKALVAEVSEDTVC
jgi:hypothetical protein